MKKLALSLMVFMLVLACGCSPQSPPAGDQSSEPTGAIAPESGAPATSSETSAPADTAAPESGAPAVSGEPTGSAATNPENPVVTIEMASGGKILVELYPDVAPNTVNNFISVINAGLLDGSKFHRVSPDFMIQGGEIADGRELPYTIKGEFSQNGVQNDLKHTRGVISMARTNNPDSATTQFFLMTADSPFLDTNYAGFGKVIEGMDVVDAIAGAEWSESYGDGTGKPAVDQVMKKVTVDTKGKTYSEPESIMQ